MRSKSGEVPSRRVRSLMDSVIAVSCVESIQLSGRWSTRVLMFISCEVALTPPDAISDTNTTTLCLSDTNRNVHPPWKLVRPYSELNGPLFSRLFRSPEELIRSLRASGSHSLTLGAMSSRASNAERSLLGNLNWHDCAPAISCREHEAPHLSGRHSSCHKAAVLCAKMEALTKLAHCVLC